MREDKVAKLHKVLSSLSRRQAVAVARGVETERALGHETLPTATILEALRPQLREGEAKRVPTLCRLICTAFEDFLSDRQDDPRLPGVIARAAIEPWWQALNLIAGPDIRSMEAELKELVARNDEAGIAAFGDTAARAARGWTDRLLQRLGARKGEAELKKLFADPLFVLDVEEIARLLPLGGAVRGSIDAVLRVAQQNGEARGRRIADLGPETVTEAKHQYVRLSDAFGVEVRYFALGLLNKLEHAWTILRLGRALALKGNDAALQDTEFGVIGERLIADLQRQAREIAAVAEADNAVAHLPQLQALLQGYIDDAEGLLGEFGFRRDSAWGAAILKTRAEVARAVGKNLIENIGIAALAVMPQRERPGRRHRGSGEPDLGHLPREGEIATALAGAHFLVFLAKRGERHGLALAARAMIRHIGEEIERRASRLLGEFKEAPDSSAIAAQIEAAIRVLEVLFENGRGDVLARRLHNAQYAARGDGFCGIGR
jgi:hypothetical protein